MCGVPSLGKALLAACGELPTEPSCSVPVERMTPEHQAEIVEAMLRARTQIEDVAPVQGTV